MHSCDESDDSTNYQCRSRSRSRREYNVKNIFKFVHECSTFDWKLAVILMQKYYDNLTKLLNMPKIIMSYIDSPSVARGLRYFSTQKS